MTRLDQLRIVANRLAAGAIDRGTAEEMIVVMLEQEWSKVGAAAVLLEAGTALLQAEARVVAARRTARS